MILNEVIAALVTMFRDAVPVNVYDGGDPTSVNQGDFVLVGSTGILDEDGAIVTREGSTLGAGEWADEDGEVLCSSWSWTGGTDMAARRAAALVNANLCVDAIAADRTLGGLLVNPGLAQVTELRYQPRQTAEGTQCRILFSVSYSHLNT